MSGSPIIQNEKLVGAVTHVFVNDTSKGYAIFAENMLAVADKELFAKFQEFKADLASKIAKANKDLAAIKYEYKTN